jgi:hypothetical protein
MRTRSASRYLHLARKCIDMAEQASHPNNRETLVRFAAIWLSLVADDFTEASRHHSDGPLPLYSQKRTCAVQERMSAMGQKRTFSLPRSILNGKSVALLSPSGEPCATDEHA